MRGPENGNKTAVGFLLSALFFAFCVAVGMFYSYHMDKELFGTLSAYVSAATEPGTGFKEVFAKAAKYDFKYLIIVLVSAFSVYGSFFPLLVIGFKGFSSGLAVALGARVIESLLGRIAFLSAVFLSSFLTVPLYVLMFLMGHRFAVRNRKSTEPKSQKFKDYIRLLLLGTIFFAILCIIDCLQASFGVMISAIL